MTEQRETAYLAVVYHDEPEDAATDRKVVGWFPTRAKAIAAVRDQLGDAYWNALSGSVHEGSVVTPRRAPAYWEDDDNAEPVTVTATGLE